jgi:SAM-dependent methyltransferase
MPVQDRYPRYISDQRQFFDDLITEDWATYASSDWDEVRKFEIARLFDRVQPSTILDVGCGCGFHDQEMARYPFVESVDAIDYSSKSIAKANEAYPSPKVRRDVGDLATYSAPASYDLVVSFQVIEHLDAPESYFRFCKRTCAENGHVAIFTPNRARLRNALRRLRGLEPELCDPQHYKEYSASDLIALGEGYGFTAESWFGYGINGASWIDRRSASLRLRLGYLLPWIATGICVLMKNRR